MEDGFIFEETQLYKTRVGIIGLGLMGGSLALALRGRCAALLGMDSGSEARRLAMELEVVDRVVDRAENLTSEVDLLILAAPVGAILELLDQLPRWPLGVQMVCDLGSTKTRILEKMQALPSYFDPLGGHPMCGKEHGGLANADGRIFAGSAFAFTPLARTSHALRGLADELAQAIGARPIWLEADTHDRWVAATSHTPYLVANALAAVTPLEARPLVGPGWRSAARLAPSPWSMMKDVLATNSAEILSRLQDFRQRLQTVESLLEKSQFDQLQVLLAEGAENYEELIRSAEDQDC